MGESKHELMEKYEERELYFLAILVYYKDYTTCHRICDLVDGIDSAEFPLCNDLCTLLDVFLSDNWYEFKPGDWKFHTSFIRSAEKYIYDKVDMRNFALQSHSSTVSQTNQFLSRSAQKLIKLKDYNFELCDLNGEEFFINVVCSDLDLDTMEFIAENLNFALQFQEICESGWLRKEHFRELNQETYDPRTLPEVKTCIYFGICKYLFFTLEPHELTSKTLNSILHIMCCNISTIDSLMTKDDIEKLLEIVEQCLKVDFTGSMLLLKHSKLATAITKYYNILPLSATLQLNQLYANSPPGYDYFNKFEHEFPKNLLDLGQRAKLILHSHSLIASPKSINNLPDDSLFKKCFVIDGDDEVWSVAAGPGYFLVGKYSEEESLTLYIISDQGIPIKVESISNIAPVRHIRSAGRNKFIVKTIEKVHEVTIELIDADGSFNNNRRNYESNTGSSPRAMRTLDFPEITIHNLFASKKPYIPPRSSIKTEIVKLKEEGSDEDYSDSDEIFTDASEEVTDESYTIESEAEDNSSGDSDDDIASSIENASDTVNIAVEEVENENSVGNDTNGSDENTQRNMSLSEFMESRMSELRNLNKDRLTKASFDMLTEKGEKYTSISSARLLIKDFKPDWQIRRGSRIIDAFRVQDQDKDAVDDRRTVVLLETMDDSFSKCYTLDYESPNKDEVVSYRVQDEPVSIAFSENDILVLPLKIVHSHQVLTVIQSYPQLSKEFTLPHLPQDRMQYNTLVVSEWDPRVIILLSPPNRIYIFDKYGKRPTLCIQGPTFGNNIMTVDLVGPFDRFIVVTSDDSDHNVFIYDRFTMKEVQRIDEQNELINTVAGYLPCAADTNANPFLVLGGEKGSIYCYCDPI